MSFLIRAFAPSDLPTLHAIRAAAFAPVFASFRNIVGPEIAALGLATAEQEQAELLDAIAKPDSGHTIAVSDDNGTLTGFVSWKTDIAPGIGEITLNAVHPDYGGKGIGTALYAHALAALKAAGMQLATVGTGGDPSHAPARRSYEKAGFSTHLPSIYMYRKL
ncbi:MAG: GNAT family N-acetyltransferase [Sphingomonadales bacterium]|nr:MAG: GNAT family N-acetyltransferase [Sphingomonadales bacterium]